MGRRKDQDKPAPAAVPRRPAAAKAASARAADGKPADGKPADGKPERAFDVWLDRGLHSLFDGVAAEPIPEDLLRLIEQDRNK